VYSRLRYGEHLIFLTDGVAGGDEGGVDVDPALVLLNPDFGEGASIFSAPFR